jgi:hypothetical protein
LAGSRRYSKGPVRTRGGVLQDRSQRLVFLVAGSAIALILLIVLVGVIFTVVLPPRAEVLQVGGRTFTAAEVARRAEFAVRFGNDSAAFADPARVGIDRLVREETMRRAAPALVGEVSAEDLDAELHRRLGLAEDAEDQRFAESYRDFLREIPITRREYEAIVVAQMLQTRLDEHFRGGLPETVEQIHLMVARHGDREVMEAFREAILAGADFEEAAEEHGLSEDAALDLGWAIPEVVVEHARTAVAEAEEGGITEVFADPRSPAFEVFYVAERATDRPLEDAVKAQLVSRQMTAFFEEQRDALGVREDLIGSEGWIRDRVQTAVLKALRA